MDSKGFTSTQAVYNFNRARGRAFFNSILNILNPEKRELLSFYDVKSLLKAGSEHYKGIQTIKIGDITGSEGRYKDFNKAFLPKKEHLRHRWERIAKAYNEDVTLPPIKLYKVGDIYFVRDGNHRVSVAKSQGVYTIDAEVTEIITSLKLTPAMTMTDLKEEVLAYERKRIQDHTDLGGILEEGNISFTTPGRYEEMLSHILGHKYFINMDQEEEIPLPQAARSWYKTLYVPVVKEIQNSKILNRFPGRTEADLYIWVVNHWHKLKEKYGQDFSLRETIAQYKKSQTSKGRFRRKGRQRKKVRGSLRDKDRF